MESRDSMTLPEEQNVPNSDLMLVSLRGSSVDVVLEDSVHSSMAELCTILAVVGDRNILGP